MQKPASSPPAYPIASVDNALRLLVLFRDRPRVRLSEASEYLGVAHSTAHRLMAMLAFHGFVRQEADSRAYVAGPVLTEIGLAAVRELDIRLHARPALEQLAASLGETVHLAVLEGDSVRYLDAVESPRALRVAARTGTTLAANCTASGKALLAELPDAEVTALFGGFSGSHRADRPVHHHAGRGCWPSCAGCASGAARSTSRRARKGSPRSRWPCTARGWPRPRRWPCPGRCRG